MDNLFDLKDTSDVPEIIAKELTVNKIDDFEIKIIELFKKALDGGLEELGLDQIAVGYNRLYGEVELKTRKQLSIKIYSMVNSDKPHILAVKKRKGVYKLK